MVIYKTTNLLNGRFYIGKDVKNNPNYFGSGVILKLAIKKYGKENFIKEILCECGTKYDLLEMEKYYILKYDSVNHDKGYNITNGGEGGDTFTNSINKEERRKNLSFACYGKKNGMYGKHHTKKTKLLIGERNSNPSVATRLKKSLKLRGKPNKRHSEYMKEYYQDEKNIQKTRDAVNGYYSNRSEEDKIIHSNRAKEIAKNMKSDKEKYAHYIEQQKKSQSKVWEHKDRCEHSERIKVGIVNDAFKFINNHNIDIDYFASILYNNNYDEMLKLKRVNNRVNARFGINSIIKNFKTVDNFIIKYKEYLNENKID